MNRSIGPTSEVKARACFRILTLDAMESATDELHESKAVSAYVAYKVRNFHIHYNFMLIT